MYFLLKLTYRPFDSAYFQGTLNNEAEPSRRNSDDTTSGKHNIF
jgi:hypothetical protein